jgi:tRNA nucleotidyltransferase (CCA-adding enzyme)
MASNFETVLTSVLRKITPSEKERKKVLSLADVLVGKVKKAAEKAGAEAIVRVEGSVAKDTWLRGEPDIDIFMRLPVSTLRESFGTVCLNIAKEATKDSRQVERFAEHPYLEAFVNSTRVNIVPCYQSKPGEWKSATDRTPYHTDFVKPKLNAALISQIRLLKGFMKGIGVYGAEIKVGGFSGYLCELLTLQYGTFINVIEAAAASTKPWIIDCLAYYKGRENEIPKIFEEPLVVVDPVDKGRNVASAVRQERLIEFVAASRQFLQGPMEQFFFPKPLKVYTAKQLSENMKTRGTAIVFVKFGSVKTVPDILWGQLYKTQRSLRNLLIQNDFTIVNDAVWSNETNLNLLLFEAENRFLPLAKKHIGPPIEKRLECENFMLKHLGSRTTISGPRLENGRWVVEIKRKHTDIVKLLQDKLKNGGRQVGVAELISKAFTSSVEILVNEEIAETYQSNKSLAEFLAGYLQGKPKWL